MPKRKRSSSENRDGVYDFSWYKKGFVTGSLDQGTCGSCYAWVATDQICSCNSITKNNKAILKTRLSPQQFIDCCRYKPCEGCKEGDVGCCLQWAQSNKLYTAKDYPYLNKTGKCKSNQLEEEGRKSVIGLGIEDVNSYENVSNDMLINFVDKRPVAAVMDAFMLYEQKRMKKIWKGSRIIHKSDDHSHAILIVGHGRHSDGTRYWNVKSSWGSKFGDKGFYRVAFDTCNINEIIYDCVARV